MPPTTVSELLAAARREGLELTPLTDALDTMGLDFLVGPRAHAHDDGSTRDRA